MAALHHPVLDGASEQALLLDKGPWPVTTVTVKAT